MKWKIYLLAILILCPVFILPQNSIFEWVHQAGGESNERGTAIELDSFGNAYCAGEVSDTTYFADTTFVANFGDVFLSKFSNDGDLLWIRLCGGTGLDRGLDMKIDNNDDIIVTGFFSNTAFFGDTSLTSLGFSDVFVVKFNSQGDFQWVVHGAGSNHDESLCIATDSDNNIYISGYFEETLSIGSFLLSTTTFSTMFIAKISPSGNVLWAKQAVGEDFGESISYDLVCDADKNVIVTGYFDDTTIFQDTTLYSYDGSIDIFIAKYDFNGDLIWVIQAGGDYDDAGDAITVDESGNLYIAGDFQYTATFGNITLTSSNSARNIFYGALNPSGTFQWVEQSTGSNFARPLSIYYNQVNGIAISGGYDLDFTIGDSSFTSNGTENIFLVVFSPTGSFKTALSIGDNGDDSAFDVLLDNNNFAFLIGEFEESIYFGDSLLVSHQLADIFITKINLSQLNQLGEEFSTQPINFFLYQNYPNPFNPSTKIRWQSPVSSHQTIKVFDVLGNEIETLVNEEKPAGSYEVDFNASQLSSGVYFYKLQTGSFTETKKMILMK
jgi:hypothetical protein